MSWLAIVIIAYFLNAVAILVDKFLLTKKIGDPLVYTFFISLLGLSAVALWPFDYVRPDPRSLAVAFASGLTFAAGLFYLYKALSRGDASQVAPLVGGLSPIFVLFFSFWLLKDLLTRSELIAVALLILGTLLLAFTESKIKQTWLAVKPAVAAAAFFGISFVLAKDLYTHISFITGFVLTRLSMAVGAVLLLFKPGELAAVRKSWRGGERKNSGLFIFGQATGALSVILINYAISLANVTLVNALQGLQYFFVLILVLLLGRFKPKVLSEDLASRALFIKILSLILISLGLVFIL